MASKSTMREKIWTNLEAKGHARFPGARGRIPNYEGAVDSARRLDEVAVWRRARVIKCNPDYAQVNVRARAFNEGKILYIAVPRLRDERCFLELDPDEIEGVSPWKAVTIKGSTEHGRPVRPDQVRKIDLVVCGSVAVTTGGARIGKGGGYSDLEYAIGREVGFIDENTPTLTTVHRSQIVDKDVDLEPHDFPLDWIVTPERVVRTRTDLPRPAGIDWDLLDDEHLEQMPALRNLRG